MGGGTGTGGDYTIEADNKGIYVEPTKSVEESCPFYNEGICAGKIKKYCMDGEHEICECYQRKMGAQAALEENSKLVKEAREQ